MNWYACFAAQIQFCNAKPQLMIRIHHTGNKLRLWESIIQPDESPDSRSKERKNYWLKGERFSRERGLLGKKKSTRNFLRNENNWNSNGKREGTRNVKLERGTKMGNRAGKKLESRSVYRKEIVPLLRETLARALFGVAGVAGVARQNFERRSCLFPWTNFIGLYTDGIHVI